MKYPFVYGGEPFKDIDPFSIFTTFNRGITDKNRAVIINGLIEKWDINTNTPRTFDAIPLVNNMSAWFITNEDKRGPNDVDQLWDLFRYAINYSKNPEKATIIDCFTSEFDKVKKQPGVTWKITFGLFWIRPNTFINLDGNTRDFLKRHRLIDTESIKKGLTGQNYLEICRTINQKMRKAPFDLESFAALSYQAYIETDELDELDNPDNNVIDLETVSDNQYLWINYNTRNLRNKKIEDLEGTTIEYDWGTKDQAKVRRIRATSILKPGDQAILVDIEPDNGIFARGIVTSEPHPRKNLTKSSHSVEDYVFDLKITEVFDKVPRENVLDLPSFEGVNIRSYLKGVSITDMTEEQFNEIIDYLKEEDADITHERDPLDFTQALTVSSLYFEDKESIERQVQIALLQGKNIIFTGPPGTGKSKLAKVVAEFYQADYKMITASSNWSTYETLGGYHPNKQNELYFKPGLFLSCVKDIQTGDNINQWLIIDEINRADIDKAFGSFFSVVTGDAISLPFESDTGKLIQLIPERSDTKRSKADHLYYYPADWRLIATMNTADKASLFELSYAFMRRFAFINIDVPKTISPELLGNYLSAWGIEGYKYTEQVAKLWSTLNKQRKMGPAIIEDIVQYTQLSDDLTDAVLLYVMPQLEGLSKDEISQFINELDTEVGEMIKTDKLKEFSRDFFGEFL
ncbi:MAG: AAA family ATPase [Tetragenococcus koreensis]|nr:AAA family ATPase [Tetragenococcus koreensis]